MLAFSGFQIISIRPSVYSRRWRTVRTGSSTCATVDDAESGAWRKQTGTRRNPQEASQAGSAARWYSSRPGVHLGLERAGRVFSSSWRRSAAVTPSSTGLADSRP